jgi:hypothetical protein
VDVKINGIGEIVPAEAKRKGKMWSGKLAAGKRLGP